MQTSGKTDEQRIANTKLQQDMRFTALTAIEEGDKKGYVHFPYILNAVQKEFPDAREGQLRHLLGTLQKERRIQRYTHDGLTAYRPLS